MKIDGKITTMGKALFSAMVIAALVFGGLFLFNHYNTNPTNISNLKIDLTPTPTPYHIVVSQEQSALLTPIQSGLTPASAPSPATINTVQNPVATSAAITTSKGIIQLTLFPDAAPIAAANFIKKAQSGFYSGLIFHRVENWVIQGGDPLGNGTGGANMQTELNSKPFVSGSLGMAGHTGPDGKTINNDSQFFIVKSDASWLNGQYTNFGMVTSGMDVVNKIAIGDKILEIKVQ